MSQYLSLKNRMMTVLLAVLLMGTAYADAFIDGVSAYRDGDYKEAKTLFEDIMTDEYDNARLMYYLAITHARLYDTDKAEFYYNRAVSLDPDGEVGRYAKKGLKTLDKATKLDAPPDMNKAVNSQKPADDRVQASAGYIHPANRGIVNNPANNIPQIPNQVPNMNYGGAQSYNTNYGVSPQDMMALQSLMGGNNQNNQNDWMTNMMSGAYPGMNAGMNSGMNSGMNMMPNMYGMQNPQQGGAMQNQNIDPQIFTQMMMNQMMTNFNFDSGDKD